MKLGFLILNLSLVVLSFWTTLSVEAFLPPSCCVNSNSRLLETTANDREKPAVISPEGNDLVVDFDEMFENLKALKKKEEELSKLLDQATQDFEEQITLQSQKKAHHFQRSLLQTRLQRELSDRGSSLK
mmetsp:Transcript_18506/g.27971  ORF Transcript_18506/g.27971 Transcript_18506/m.27971 type:complete len:129 (+) Transcript_18506:54-440(+)